MTFLLCDVVHHATFGKINLKNLQKLQKLDLSKADEFTFVSGLPKSKMRVTQLHDTIHMQVPMSSKKYIKGHSTVKYNKEAKKSPFLPLANPINQVSSAKPSKNYNEGIEKIVEGLEGLNRYDDLTPYENKLQQIGNALRKKKLTKVERLARYPIVTSPIFTDSKKPTQEDVVNLINKVKTTAKPKTIQQPKTKGLKPQPQTIEEKKQNLKQKYALYR